MVIRVRRISFSIMFLIGMLYTVAAFGDEPSPAAVANTNAPALLWVDVDTGKTIFTSNDIVRFDWQRQVFELAPERATKLLPMVVQRRDFAVRDRDGVIYYGRFYRSVSNEGYDGATILIDQGPLKKLPASPFFTIAGGYPNGGGAHDRDRFATRMQAALQQAGVLSQITNSEMPVERTWGGHTWVGGEQVVKASTALFPTTFRVGCNAYLHLFLTKTPKADFDFDQLIVEITCTADQGSFVARQQVLKIAPPLLDNGVYVCKFQPWQGMEGPAPVSDTNKPPVLKNIELPRYPKNALNEDREGTVLLGVSVSEGGKIGDQQMLKSSGSNDIDRAALRAVAKCTCTPALVAGKAVAQNVKIQFTFVNRKVTAALLPPEPKPAVAHPGPMNLSVKIIGMKKDGDTLKQFAVWELPPHPMTLLPELPVKPALVK